MNDLYGKTCEPCRTGADPMTTKEIEKQKALAFTHKVKGLHLNDFIMAAKTDRLI